MRTVSAQAYPFAVGYVPDGYRLSAIGRGNDVAEWDDEMGSDEPFTVLDVDGDSVVARVVPWEPVEGELRWASTSGDTSPELFVLDDGRNAAFGQGQSSTYGSGSTAWNDVVVEVEPGVALHVAGDAMTRDVLVEVAEAIDPAIERTAAPVVSNVADSWRVLGSVQPDGVVAMAADVRPRTSAVPGPDSAYSIGFDRALAAGSDGGLTDTLAVMTLPGDSIDLAALSAPRFAGGEVITPLAVDVDGRPGFVSESYGRFGGSVRSLVTTGDDGALIVVASSGGSFVDPADLVRVAASVAPVGSAEWDGATVEAFGGPGLNPDDGESAIAAGTFGDVGWLLQTRTAEVPEGIVGSTAGTFVNVDECLKLSTLERLCTSAGFGGSGGSISVWNTSSPGFDEMGVPPFVTITSDDPDAVIARLSSGGESHDVELHRVPGGADGNATAGLAVLDVPPGMIATCHPNPAELPQPPSGMAVGRVDLIDDAGTVIGCIGF